ncbi:MAG: ATP-dependent DNA helicase RecG [Minisyncoccia bacterium]
MKLEDLEVNLEEVKFISKKVIEKLNKRNIKTIRDLIFYFPFSYLDFTEIKKIKDIKLEEKVLIKGKVIETKTFLSPKNKIFILQILLSDETSSVKVIWFNQPYLTKKIKRNVKLLLFGKLTHSKGFGLYFQPQKFQLIQNEGEENFMKRIVPVYEEISGLKSSYLEKLIKTVLNFYDIENLEDPLPEKILEEKNFPSLGKALWEIHQPSSFENLELSKKRLSFEELLYIELALLLEKKELKENPSPIILKDEELINDFMKNFSFSLTPGQIKVLDEIFSDLKSGKPMNRLLQGETGSGKTLIAEIVALHFLKEGYQVVFMAPTEILAQQHFQRILSHFAKYDFGLGLLTSGQTYYGLKGYRVSKSLYEILRMVSQMKINFLIGTHSLIENEIPFRKVGFVIIDEQQRFGVKQRQKLLENSSQNFVPHFLSMSATPIPRSLALALYGDLDFSYLEDKPHGTKPVKTFVILDKEKEKLMYKLCFREIKEGHQIYIICPRVEEKEETASVKKEYEKALKIFSPLKANVAMLHGKMSSFEKESILKRMQKNEIQVLVSSSVVEVGIDLPLATVIIIKSPESFGLSQLYQLRGRVGRSIHQGYAFLVPEKLTEKAKLRISYFLKAKSALELSEYDLKLRGAGEFLGEKQSGIPDIVMKSLSNLEFTLEVKKTAEKIISLSPDLSLFPKLKKEVNLRKKELFSLA